MSTTNVAQNEETSRQLSGEEKEALREQMTTYRKVNGFGQKGFAFHCKIMTAGYVSQIETGQYEQVSTEMWIQLRTWLNSRTNNKLFETLGLKAGINVLIKAQRNQLMVGIIAPTGSGKSTLLKFFSNRRNVFLVVYGKSMKPKQFLRAVLAELGMNYEGDLHQMVQAIADKLNSLQNPLLLIDEAGKIPDATMMYLQEVRDKTIENCGIALAALPYLRDNLDKFARKGKPGYAEFNRRIELWQSLDDLQPAETKYICEKSGITDKADIKTMSVYRHFADLKNAIRLHHIENEESNETADN